MINTLFDVEDNKRESVNFFIADKSLALIKIYTLDGEPPACFDVITTPPQVFSYIKADRPSTSGCCTIETSKAIAAISNTLQLQIETSDCDNTWAVSSKTGLGIISITGYYKLFLRDANSVGKHHVTIEFLNKTDDLALIYSKYDVSLPNCNCLKPVPDATLPLADGGFIYRPTDIKDPLATVELKTCEGEVWAYAYPTASAKNPIPIKACTAAGLETIGYAKTTSSVSGIVTPDFC